MREIKFRAWHPDTKEVMPVDCIDWDETGYLTEVNAGYCWAEKFDPVKFQKLVLMQYTGLKDKNGKEIYEGDIIKFLLAGIGERNLVVSYNILQGFYPMQGTNGWATDGKGEVIGNIYENPDLLK